MKRKGWHRKKRRRRHDYVAQYANTLFNLMMRMREESRERSRQFEAFLVETMSKAPRGSLDAIGTPCPGPATDNGEIHED